MAMMAPAFLVPMMRIRASSKVGKKVSSYSSCGLRGFHNSRISIRMKTTTYSFAACTSSSHTAATTTATTANRRRHQKERRRKRQKLTTNNAAAAGAAEAVTSGLEVAQLGRDTMVFLAATVGVVPLCKNVPSRRAQGMAQRMGMAPPKNAGTDEHGLLASVGSNR